MIPAGPAIRNGAATSLQGEELDGSNLLDQARTAPGQPDTRGRQMLTFPGGVASALSAGPEDMEVELIFRPHSCRGDDGVDLDPKGIETHQALPIDAIPAGPTGGGLAFGPATTRLPGHGGPAHQVDRRRGRGTMTDLIEHADTEPADSADRVTEGARGGPVAPKRRGLAGAMRRPRAVIVAICVVVVAGALGAVAMATTSGSGKINTATNSRHLDRVGGLAQVHAPGGRGGD